MCPARAAGVARAAPGVQVCALCAFWGPLSQRAAPRRAAPRSRPPLHSELLNACFMVTACCVAYYVTPRPFAWSTPPRAPLGRPGARPASMPRRLGALKGMSGLFWHPCQDSWVVSHWRPHFASAAALRQLCVLARLAGCCIPSWWSNHDLPSVAPRLFLESGRGCTTRFDRRGACQKQGPGEAGSVQPCVVGASRTPRSHRERRSPRPAPGGDGRGRECSARRPR